MSRFRFTYVVEAADKRPPTDRDALILALTAIGVDFRTQRVTDARSQSTLQIAGTMFYFDDERLVRVEAWPS